MPGPPIGRAAGTNVRRRLRAARQDAALTGTGTAMVAACVILLTVTGYVLQTWGLLRPGAWAWGLGAGVCVLAGKVALDLFDRSADALHWRSVLSDAFGDGMRADAEVARQARLAIEFRTRLADAEGRADRAALRRIEPELSRLDGWLDGIVELARRVAAQRGEAAFQSGLAARARQRRTEIGAKAGATGDPVLAAQLRQTAEGLEAQIRAAEGYVRSVEASHLRLEHAVGSFGAICSQLALLLSESGDADVPAALTNRIGAESADVGRQIRAIGEMAEPVREPDQPGGAVDVSRQP
jgi:hypothetical protein